MGPDGGNKFGERNKLMMFIMNEAIFNGCVPKPEFYAPVIMNRICSSCFWIVQILDIS